MKKNFNPRLSYDENVEEFSEIINRIVIHEINEFLMVNQKFEDLNNEARSFFARQVLSLKSNEKYIWTSGKYTWTNLELDKADSEEYNYSIHVNKEYNDDIYLSRICLKQEGECIFDVSMEEILNNYQSKSANTNYLQLFDIYAAQLLVHYYIRNNEFGAEQFYEHYILLRNKSKFELQKYLLRIDSSESYIIEGKRQILELLLMKGEFFIKELYQGEIKIVNVDEDEVWIELNSVYPDTDITRTECFEYKLMDRLHLTEEDSLFEYTIFAPSEIGQYAIDLEQTT